MTSRTLKELKRDHRNLTPHAAAVAAMYLYGAEYAAQSGGSMDFWDKLDSSRRRICCDLVFDIGRASLTPAYPATDCEKSDNG